MKGLRSQRKLISDKQTPLQVLNHSPLQLESNEGKDVGRSLFQFFRRYYLSTDSEGKRETEKLVERKK